MNTTFRLDERGLNAQIQRVHEISRKSLGDVVADQTGLLLRDSIRFTPPFGDAPIEESWKTQKEIGEKAIAWQIGNAFISTEDLKDVRNATDVGERIKVLARKRNLAGIEAIFRNKKIRADVVPEANRDLHARIRDRWGRVRRWHAYFTPNRQSIKRLITANQRMVGYAKSGWMKALNEINAKRRTRIPIPPWIKKHNGAGYYRDLGNKAASKVGFEVGNAVPYAQKHEAHILRRAYDNRRRNIALQIQKAEQYIRGKLRQAKFS